MPGPVKFRAVRQFGRRLKISGDHQLTRVGRGDGVVENALVSARAQRPPS